MERKELTKPFMMLSNYKILFSAIRFNCEISVYILKHFMDFPGLKKTKIHFHLHHVAGILKAVHTPTQPFQLHVNESPNE